MSNPIIDEFSNKWWYKDNTYILHREDGPAVELKNGFKQWWINDKLHREDGPAVEWATGKKEWWYRGQKLDCATQEEFERLIKLELFW